MTNNPISIYIHYPFCKSKCPYCDFNSHVQESIPHSNFLNAYLRELEYFSNLTNSRQVKSIFFGGGTPSLMPISLVEAILEKIESLWQLAENIEISLEANPTSVEATSFSALKKAGINRLSLGIQSLNDNDLKFLGREHSSKEAKKAINIAQKYFDNFSFDLIYARPNQTSESWRKELEEALAIGSPHLSLYQLTIEKGTKFFGEYRKKKFQLPSDEIQTALYDLTGEISNKYGLELYEVSNYAKKGFECLHNLNYWQYGDYIGIGAGAHGRISFKDNKKHFMNHHQPEKWLKNVLEKGNAIQQSNFLNEKEILEEILIMGLRTKLGIDGDIFKKFLGKDHLEIFGSKKLESLKMEGLINYNQTKITPTLKGLKLTNSVYQYLAK